MVGSAVLEWSIILLLFYSGVKELKSRMLYAVFSVLQIHVHVFFSQCFLISRTIPMLYLWMEWSVFETITTNGHNREIGSQIPMSGYNIGIG